MKGIILAGGSGKLRLPDYSYYIQTWLYREQRESELY